MAENNYVEGSLEWEAWGLGRDYALAHGNTDPEPLSGEWAEGPWTVDIIREAWRRVMGPSWDTYTDGTDDDRDSDTDVLDAWESGYFGEEN